jgi:hypothetical protein
MARKAFLLRIDPAVLAEVQRWADEDLRSLNGQIEFLLRQALARRKVKLPEETPDDPLHDAAKEGPAGSERPGG